MPSALDAWDVVRPSRGPYERVDLAPVTRRLVLPARRDVSGR